MKSSILALAVVAAASAACPDLTQFRTDAIKTSFDPAMLVGFWYEQAYTDIAQAGSSCQTLNTTYVDPSAAKDPGMLSMDFKVKYGPLPFTIVEQYRPQDATTKGWYKKKADMPGGGLIVLPTVVVDATLSADKTQYDTMTLYSCDVGVTELVFATRVKAFDNRCAVVPFPTTSCHHRAIETHPLFTRAARCEALV
jgi:hypothetical protein